MNIDRKKFHSNVLGIPFIIVDKQLMDHYNITVDDLFDNVITVHNIIAEQLNVTADYVKSKILKYVNIRDLVDLSITYAPHTMLIALDGMYKLKQERCGYNYKTIKEYYNVYICEHSYIDIKLEKVIHEILTEKYPEIFDHIFLKEIERFPDKSIFNINENTTINELAVNYLNYNVKDIYDIISGSAAKDDKIIVSLFNIYFIQKRIMLFLELDKEMAHSLYIPLDAILKKDWNIIENEIVHNIRIDNNYNFYSGPQKNAPYFNHDIVKKLKNIYLQWN